MLRLLPAGSARSVGSWPALLLHLLHLLPELFELLLLFRREFSFASAVPATSNDAAYEEQHGD